MLILTFCFHFITLTFLPFYKSFIHQHSESIKKLPKFEPKALKFKDYHFISIQTVRQLVDFCSGYISTRLSGDRGVVTPNPALSINSYMRIWSVFFKKINLLLQIRTHQLLGFNLSYCMSLKKVKSSEI